MNRFLKKKRPRKLRGASHRRHLSALCPSANSSSTQSIIIGPASVSLPTIKTRTNTLESLSHINQSTVERDLIFLSLPTFLHFPSQTFCCFSFSFGGIFHIFFLLITTRPFGQIVQCRRSSSGKFNLNRVVAGGKPTNLSISK